MTGQPNQCSAAPSVFIAREKKGELFRRLKRSAVNLVPKLRLGTHFRETLFREQQSKALREGCSQAGAWEQVTSFLLQTSEMLRISQ